MFARQPAFAETPLIRCFLRALVSACDGLCATRLSTLNWRDEEQRAQRVCSNTWCCDGCLFFVFALAIERVNRLTCEGGSRQLGVVKLLETASHPKFQIQGHPPDLPMSICGNLSQFHFVFQALERFFVSVRGVSKSKSGTRRRYVISFSSKAQDFPTEIDSIFHLCRSGCSLRETCLLKPQRNHALTKRFFVVRRSTVICEGSLSTLLALERHRKALRSTWLAKGGAGVVTGIFLSWYCAYVHSIFVASGLCGCVRYPFVLPPTYLHSFPANTTPEVDALMA